MQLREAIGYACLQVVRRLQLSRIAFLVAVLVLFVVIQASAQNRPSKFEWFIEGGESFLKLGNQTASIPLSQQVQPSPEARLLSPNHFSTSWAFFTGVRYHVTANNALEASYSLSYEHEFEAERVPAGSTGPLRFERYTGSLNYVRYLPEHQAWRPFVTLGLGDVQTSFAGRNQYNASFNFGLGTDVRLNPRVALRLEVRDFIAYVPAPLRGTSQDLAPSAGLVFTSSPRTTALSAFPQVEIFIEGGLSVVTGASQPGPPIIILRPNGPSSVENSVISSSFSKTGRVLAGFRVYLTHNNAVEVSWSQSPNRYSYLLKSTAESAVPVTLPPRQLTQALHNIPVNYVRYLPGLRGMRPFVTGGLGIARYAGFLQDFNSFTWNFGAGTDIALERRLALRFEFRDYIVGQAQPFTGVTHNPAPMVGLVYRFD